MRLVFCMWGVPIGGAVETAWKRLASLFVASGSDVCFDFFGSSFFDVYQASWRDLRKERYIVCATIWQVLLVRVLTAGTGVRIIYWVQGLVAEEAYLKNSSILKLNLLLIAERTSFFLASSYIYVSEFMEEFYRKRYPFSAKKKYLVVPCVSDLVINKSVFRNKNSYCYLGGMSAWQRFDAVIKIMNGVVRSSSLVSFSVATKDVDVCREMLSIHASKELLAVTTVRSLNGKEEVERFLSSQQFGFLLRDDNSINNVASPIKLAEYLSCGVNVISTRALKSFSSIIIDAGYLVDLSKGESAGLQQVFEYRGEDLPLSAYERYFSYASAVSGVRSFIKRLSAS